MIPHEVIEKEIAGLSDNHLFDLARNIAAPLETRTFAAAKLLDKGAYQAAKSEISGLIASIKIDWTPSEQESDNFAAHDPQPEAPEAPVVSASFTTSSIQ